MKMKRIANNVALQTIGYVISGFTNVYIYVRECGYQKRDIYRGLYSCASLLYANGVSLKEIQEWLGHSDIGTTSNIYTHLDYSNKVSSANAIPPCCPQTLRAEPIGQ
jgi:hypothetical protein